MNKLRFSLVFSDRCDMQCKYCCLKQQRPYEKTSYEMLCRIMKRLNESISNFDIKLFLTYAEPLMEFDTFKNYVKESEKYNRFSFGFITGGTLLDKEKLQWLRDNKDKVEMTFSLDGNAEACKGRIRENGKSLYGLIDIEKLFKENGDLVKRIACVISPYSVKYLHKSIVYMADVLGIKDITFLLCMNEDWLDENIKDADIELGKVHNEYIARYGTPKQINLDDKRTSFDSPFNPIDVPCELAIGTNGEIYHCLTVMFLGMKKYYYGNIFDENIDIEKIYLDRKICSACEIKSRYSCPSMMSNPIDFAGKNTDKLINIWKKWRENTVRELNDR